MSATNRSQHRQRGFGRGLPAHQQLLHDEEQAARQALAGYNDRENARALAIRTYIGSCPVCASPIYENPGHCVQCAWTDREDAAR